MAQDSDLEKTEPATPRRLQKAREEGQVARSRELGTFLALICGIGALWLGGDAIFRTLRGILLNGLWFDTRIARDPQVMLNVAGDSAWHGLMIVLPFMALLLVVGIFSSVALGGFLLSGKALEPKFERLNPLAGIKRLFAAQTLIELVKTLAKAGLVGFVGVKVIWAYRDDMLALSRMAPTEALARGLDLTALCCLLIASSLIIIVLIDVPWQIWNHAKQLRMSKDDVKQEHKDSDGDPHVKGRIRSQQRAMARRRMMSAVPEADVVVTNPTHYAVALRYREGQGGAPVVVAKGTRLIAAQIREIADRHGVALLEAPPLARALYHHVELDREIPVALYATVAEVLAWVYQVRNWQHGSGTLPQAPRDLRVPPELDPQHGPEPVPVPAS
ncbi:Flagellar biosynthesis protein FlhB [Castellaniella defragrans 65Phen]|uniref:Flagellar biosynthetic protein FlhB n=2 Tax=Castellaniella defragrans TaxID=75697 RepID=W8X9H5_CASD6|nr:flagellar biosynthesis protein FlhB [Castellaniella defragrans]KAB0606598.1 flagellar type III secretion system protein FlhB [Castellaniella defragrans]MBB6082411.1 flagellar biosynthetic protein FlhB [Castellaniella defragrans]CDM24835.1 Flagellar biosynthesis protein FlhB [Castellaniella defragrans 65Phen]